MKREPPQNWVQRMGQHAAKLAVLAYKRIIEPALEAAATTVHDPQTDVERKTAIAKEWSVIIRELAAAALQSGKTLIGAKEGAGSEPAPKSPEEILKEMTKGAKKV